MTTTTSSSGSTTSTLRNRLGITRGTSTTTTQLRGGGGFGGSGISIFNNTPLYINQGIILGINGLGFIISLCTSSHYHVDLLGTGAFAVAALVPARTTTFLTKIRGDQATRTICNWQNIQRIQWSTTAVTIWSMKLASFLFYRVLQNGHDARLDKILNEPRSSIGFWFISALWGMICSLPHSIGTTSSLPGSIVARNIGTTVFGLGLFIETLADYQKYIFKGTNPNTICNVGLWSITQHPNWFGNILLWFGIFIMNAPALVEPIRINTSKRTLLNIIYRYRRVGYALMSPAFMYSLFRSQATGAILEDSYQANLIKYGYGKDPIFTNYIDKTPKLIPNPFQWIGTWWTKTK